MTRAGLHAKNGRFNQGLGNGVPTGTCATTAPSHPDSVVPADLGDCVELCHTRPYEHAPHELIDGRDGCALKRCPGSVAS